MRGVKKTGRAFLQAGKPHLGKASWMALGFAIAGLIFAPRGCSDQKTLSSPVEDVEKKSKDFWTCSMHPQIRQPDPGQCPICAMDLILVASNTGPGSTDVNRVVLSDRAKALIKLRTVRVERRPDASAQLRLLGRIVPNEASLKTVTAWISGRIDKLHVNVTGVRVRPGQVIATLYSPEVYAAHKDLLVAKNQVDRRNSSLGAGKSTTSAAREAAFERLRLLGVPEYEIARMETQAQPVKSVAIRTPFGGTVIERLATEGIYVSTGAPLYRIADLSTLWVWLDAYESDLARLSVGQAARVMVEAAPGEEFRGEVTFIQPTLDPVRRIATIRVEIQNQDGRLRPGLFAQAVVDVASRQDERAQLTIPMSAVLFTGQRAVVYVEVQQDGRSVYEPRTVRLGPRLGEFYPVVAGLSEGERVVMRGAFALDADLQIRAGDSMMSLPDDLESGAWDDVVELTPKQRAKLAPVISAYLTVQQALAADNPVEARKGAKRLIHAIESVRVGGWESVKRTIRVQAEQLGATDDLEGLRLRFEDVGQGVQRILQRFGNPIEKTLYLAFCPMASGSRGAYWVQLGTTIDNSYFGASMRKCGEIKQEIRPGAYLQAASDPKNSNRVLRKTGGHRH